MNLKGVYLKFYLVTKLNLLEMRYLACYVHMNTIICRCFSKVRIEDHVIFESEKAEGIYLHTSSRTYNQTTLHENT